MDVGYTYGGPNSLRIMIYAPPELEPPEEIEMTAGQQRMQFVRLSDRSLACYKADGGCGSYDCHRHELGICECGAHPGLSARPQRASPGEAPEQNDPRPPAPTRRRR